MSPRRLPLKRRYPLHPITPRTVPSVRRVVFVPYTYTGPASPQIRLYSWGPVSDPLPGCEIVSVERKSGGGGSL